MLTETEFYICSAKRERESESGLYIHACIEICTDIHIYIHTHRFTFSCQMLDLSSLQHVAALEWVYIQQCSTFHYSGIGKISADVSVAAPEKIVPVEAVDRTMRHSRFLVTNSSNNLGAYWITVLHSSLVSIPGQNSETELRNITETKYLLGRYETFLHCPADRNKYHSSIIYSWLRRKKSHTRLVRD